MNNANLQCDVLIIGAGIAGVSIAERISREARRRNKLLKVLVIDSAPALASGASAGLQGWFHTGSLYTRLSSKESYLNCAESHKILEREYATASDFVCHQNCNISVDSKSNRGWFGDPIRFVIDQSDRPDWAQQVHQMTNRLQGLGGFTAPCLQIDNERYTTVSTPDRSLRTQAIVADLADSAASNGTTFLMGYRFSTPQCVSPNKPISIVNPNGSQYLVHATHTLITTGYEIPTPSHVELSRRSGVIVSVTPALDAPNIVRIAREPSDNISHIAHPESHVFATGFSAIGDSTSLPGHPSKDECIQTAQQIRMKVKAILGKNVFEGRRVAWHTARKVDVAINNSDARTFGPMLYPISQSCHAVIPSKFSLFPLLAEMTYSKLVHDGLFEDLHNPPKKPLTFTVPPVAPLLSQKVLGIY